MARGCQAGFCLKVRPLWLGVFSCDHSLLSPLQGRPQGAGAMRRTGPCDPSWGVSKTGTMGACWLPFKTCQGRRPKTRWLTSSQGRIHRAAAGENSSSPTQGGCESHLLCCDDNERYQRPEAGCATHPWRDLKPRFRCAATSSTCELSCRSGRLGSSGNRYVF